VAEAHRRALERREAERKALVQRRAGADEVPLDPSRDAPRDPAPVAQPPAPGDQRTTPPAAEPEVRRFGVQPAHAAGPTNGVRSDAPVPVTPAAPAAPVPAPPPQGRGEPVPANAAPATGPSEPRYWDQPPPTGRFIRMRPPAEDAPPAGERAEPGREIRQVGRLRPEAPPPPNPERPARMIRPLGEAQQAENPPGAAQPGAAGRQPRPQPAGVAMPELPPRQADQTLVRELEREWREQKLVAQAGKRCGTCRYYQATDGGRGACGCQFAPVYRQPLPPQELGCLNPLGSWWAAGDEGWLEKTEPRRPRRATPLLDALERELSEIAALAAAGALERRRQAR